MKPIYIVCGVPASGKSWVCEQLSDHYEYLAHDGWDQRHTTSNDEYLKNYAQDLVDTAARSDRPVVGDCPFAERLLRDELTQRGASANFVFLTVNPDALVTRYVERNKPLPKGHITRLKSIKERAKEWGSFFGTSDQALLFLKLTAKKLKK